MKSRIIIEGSRVHDVGYRPFLLQYAQIKGFANFFAMNIIKDGRQQVLVTLQESDSIIKEFISYLSSNKPDFAEVTSILSEEYDGEVVPIGTFLQDLLFEQWRIGITAILRIEETQNEWLKKQDQMLHLQHDTVDEIRGLRSDSGNYLEREFTEIKQKLHAIENALNREGIQV